MESHHARRVGRGRATIVAKSSQTVTVTSEPADAAVSIVNGSGRAVHSGQTPLTVTLRKGRGYFKPEHYVVRFSKAGYQTTEVRVDGTVNGWYFGNILIGGLIGMLAVDPVTGAMFTLKPKDVSAALVTMNAEVRGEEPTLTVVLVEDLPWEIVDQLVPIAMN